MTPSVTPRSKGSIVSPSASTALEIWYVAKMDNMAIRAEFIAKCRPGQTLQDMTFNNAHRANKRGKFTVGQSQSHQRQEDPVDGQKIYFHFVRIVPDQTRKVQDIFLRRARLPCDYVNEIGIHKILYNIILSTLT